MSDVIAMHLGGGEDNGGGDERRDDDENKRRDLELAAKKAETVKIHPDRNKRTPYFFFTCYIKFLYTIGIHYILLTRYGPKRML